MHAPIQMLTVVLLPGMDGTGTLFAPLRRHLSGAVATQVVAYPPDQRLGYAELADWAEAALPTQGDVVLLGESFSGPVAIMVAARVGQRLKGLVLACSFARAPWPTLAPLRQLARLMPPPGLMIAPLSFMLMGRHAKPELRRALSDAMATVRPSVLRQRGMDALSVDVSRLLASIRCPLLYLQATQDRVVPEGCAAHVRRCCLQTEVERIAGPHFLLQTQPQAAATVLEAFLQRLR